MLLIYGAKKCILLIVKLFPNEENATMKIKGIIAVSLVFSIAFALGACRKVEKGSKDEGENYNNGMFVVDSIGETHEVETQLNEDTGETEYVYKDDMGNVVVVEKKDVGQTQFNISTTVTNKNGETVAGETQTLPEDISDFLEGLTDPDQNAGADYLEDQQAELTISEDLIDTDDMKEVSPPLTSEGNPQRPAMSDFAQEVKKSKQYTIKMTAKNISPDGEISTIPFTIMRSGDNMYMETQFPIDGSKYLTVRALVKDGKCIMYIPSIRAYMELPSDSINEILNGVDQYTDPDKDPDTGEYKSSGEVTVGGVKYNVDIYEDEDGAEVKYYYQGDQLKRIESVEKSGNTTIIEYESITNTVDKSKFVAPTGYFNLGNISDEDQLAALLG